VATPVEIKANRDVVLPPVVEQPVIYKVVVPSSGGVEYFLFENRQQMGFDVGLALNDGWTGTSHGLAIYHVDDTVFGHVGPDGYSNYWRPNEAENWNNIRYASAKLAPNGETHYAVSLVQADGKWHLERGANSGDGGDLYPGTGAVRRFDESGNPNSTTYYFYPDGPGRYGKSGLSVQNIQEANGVITAQIRLAK